MFQWWKHSEKGIGVVLSFFDFTAKIFFGGMVTSTCLFKNSRYEIIIHIVSDQQSLYDMLNKMKCDLNEHNL